MNTFIRRVISSATILLSITLFSPLAQAQALAQNQNAITVGSVFVTSSSDNVPAVDVVPGAKDVTVGKFDLRATEEDARIYRLIFRLTGSARRHQSLTNGRLYKSDGTLLATVGAPYRGVFDVTALDLKLQKNVPLQLKFVADVPLTALAGTTTGVSLSRKRQVVAFGMVSGKKSKVRGAWPVDGSVVNIKTSSAVRVTVDATAPSTVTVAQGAQNVSLFTLNFSAMGEDVIIRELEIFASDAESKHALVSGFLVSENGSVVGTKLMAQNGQFTFSNLELTVPQGQQMKLTFKANLASAITAGTSVSVRMYNSSNVHAIGKASGAVLFVDGAFPLISSLVKVSE